MIKTSPSPTQAEEPIKAKAWKNLHFLKDGRTVLGEKIWNHPDDARKMVNENIVGRLHLFEKWNGAFSKQFHFYSREYHHTIQIPWNREG